MIASMTLNRYENSNYVIIAGLKSEPTCETLFASLDIKFLSSASRTHVESFSKPRDSASVLEALHGKLDIKRHSPYPLCIRDKEI